VLPSTSSTCDFQHFLPGDGISNSSFRNLRSKSCIRDPGRSRLNRIITAEPVQFLLHRTLAELADQYLEFGRDARKAAATRTWLVTAFVGAARKRHDFATARLLAIRPAALAAPAVPTVPTPSLEDFAAEHDPDGFYTEKELLDLFRPARQRQC
jgi:hypothetical protein